MAVYLLLTLTIILLASSEVAKISSLARKIIFLIVFAILTLFVGLRDRIGSDWAIYEKIFEDLKTTGATKENVEYGYRLMNNIFAKLNFGFNAFILVFSFLSILLKMQALKKLSTNVLIVLIYYLAYFLTEYEMSGIRQAFAMCFAFFAFVYVEKKDFKTFLFFIFLGTFFHLSILFLIPAYFLDRIKFTTRSSLILMLVSVSFVLFNASSVILKLLTLLPAGSIVVAKISSYSEMDNMQVGFTLGHVLYLLFGAIFLLYRTKNRNARYDLFLNIYLAGLAFSFLFSGSLGVLNRATYYYLVTGGILFSFIIENSTKLHRLLMFGFLSLLLIVKVIESVTDSSMSKYYIPYKTIAF